MTEQKRTASTGLLRIRIDFLDGSVLHVREYVDLDAADPRLMYSYQYMDAQARLRFRYDNTDHHRHLKLATHPHHKHDGADETVVASAAPTLAAVLAEVELMVRVS